MAPNLNHAKPTGKIDKIFEAIGLYRKQVPIDESCVFRIIAEEVLHSQHSFELVKQTLSKVLDIDATKLKSDYILQPQNITLVAEEYKCDFLLWELDCQHEKKLTNNGYKKKIQLCSVGGGCYDHVLSLERVENMAFAQSIVYNILYTDVFGLANAQAAAVLMLDETGTSAVSDALLDDTSDQSLRPSNSKYWKENLEVEEKEDVGETLIGDALKIFRHGGTPFPYTAAKALHPRIFRNIEFDLWMASKKNRKFYATKFYNAILQVGTKCLAIVDGTATTAYIQQMHSRSSHSRVEVFVQELGKRMWLPFSSLRLLPIEDIAREATVMEQIKSKTRTDTLSSPEPADEPGKLREDDYSLIEREEGLTSERSLDVGFKFETINTECQITVPLYPVGTSSDISGHLPPFEDLRIDGSRFANCCQTSYIPHRPMFGLQNVAVPPEGHAPAPANTWPQIYSRFFTPPLSVEHSRTAVTSLVDAFGQIISRDAGFFPVAPGFPNCGSVFSTQQPGFPSHESGYPLNQLGYLSHQPEFQTHGPGFPAGVNTIPTTYEQVDPPTLSRPFEEEQIFLPDFRMPPPPVRFQPDCSQFPEIQGKMLPSMFGLGVRRTANPGETPQFPGKLEHFQPPPLQLQSQYQFSNPLGNPYGVGATFCSGRPF